MTGPGPVATRAGTALALLGDHWTLQILQRVFMGERRYHRIRDAIGVSDAILSDRLRTLVAGGLLVRVPYRDGRTRYEYHLAPAGRDTWTIFVAAWVWERTWVPAASGRRAELRHVCCGSSAVPDLVCQACGAPVSVRETSVGNPAGSLRYGGALPRRHVQNRTLRRRDPYSFLPETLELLGDRWNMALLAAAAIGSRRFSDFERFLGTPPAVLSARLVRFQELGMLRARAAEPGNGRSEYRLTDKGRAFAPVLLQLVGWADEHADGDAENSIEIRHVRCGQRLRAGYRCGSCGRPLVPAEVRFELSAAPSAPLSAPPH